MSPLEQLTGSWVATTVEELHACAGFEDESTPLWGAVPALAHAIRQSDSSVGADTMRSHVRGGEQDEDLALAATIITLGSTVLETATRVVVLEREDALLVAGEAGGWTGAVLILADQLWVTAAPHALPEELRAQSALTDVARVRTVVLDDTGHSAMAVVDGMAARVSTGDDQVVGVELGADAGARLERLLEALGIASAVDDGAVTT